MKKQFNYKDVECNGVGGHGYQAVLKHKDAIQEICQDVRDLLGDKLWDKMIEHSKETGRNDSLGYHAGTRFSNVEDNTYRLITGIARHTAEYMPNSELLEMHVGAILPMLTMEEKVYMVLDALRDCASADHWYTYEKDWG